jgi:membrane protease YdiL (CAAX protease family)
MVLAAGFSMDSCNVAGDQEVIAMKAWTRWQDWVSLVLGVILFITPWVFGTVMHGWSSWDAWIVGVIGVILALLALALFRISSAFEWLSLILGVWLFISPWILGFAVLGSAAWVAWIIGILFVVANGWALLQTGSPRVGATA